MVVNQGVEEDKSHGDPGQDVKAEIMGTDYGVVFKDGLIGRELDMENLDLNLPSFVYLNLRSTIPTGFLLLGVLNKESFISCDTTGTEALDDSYSAFA